MRQIFKIGCQTKTHFLHLREFSLTCRHVAVQPQRTMNELYISRNTHGVLRHPHRTPLLRKNKHAYLISNYIAQRGISKSSKLENSSTLSLEDVKVQQYLRKLREDNAAALQGEGDTSVQVAHSQMSLMMLLDQVERLQSDIKELSALAENNEGDKEMQDMVREELKEIKEKLVDLQEEVFSALIPEEVMDGRNVVVEVSAGVGGQEAMLFCQEVFNMYLSYALHRGWEEEVTDYEATDIGGLRHGSLVLSGDSVYSSLKYEGGIHRVQRVPKTEKAGRVHTSTVSVAVLPQPTEIDIQLLDKDLKIETKRASGAGGQHVNTTDSAVRIIHVPTGLTVESQSERSQQRNKDQCLRKLRALLYQQQLDQDTQKYNSSRKLQVGAKGRSEKIRTYNFPQDRVTDHRLGVSMHNLVEFMSGSEHFHALVIQLVKEGQRETLQEIICGMKT
ncbi:peptide chain release factor 1-like, mitochondrial isoform X2 [Portunus trituberculatus]|uniref:peptide chain release factor 1-like, mitochondrial isoform X2 n=1 Tax=Portunus trituberculatus TaxID=210409 RepID=UPI001E1CE2EF|nr:peptide chain release factor 1-like, mitochondrial isoform X2 [Portunus trituberculatus]